MLPNSWSMFETYYSFLFIFYFKSYSTSVKYDVKFQNQKVCINRYKETKYEHFTHKQ